MDRKEKKALKARKKQEKIRNKQEQLREAGRFKQWRKRRPFLGAVLTVLTGLLILWIPLHLYAIDFVPGNFAFIGVLFGGLITIIGVMAFIYPPFSTVFGVFTIFLSVLSVMGALGGFLVGTILGIIAGALCIGWKQEVVTAGPNREWSQEAEALEGGRVQTAVGENQFLEAEQRDQTLRPSGSTSITKGNEEAASTVDSAVDVSAHSHADKPQKGKTKKRGKKAGSSKRSPEEVLNHTASTKIIHEGNREAK
ncbi:MAG TPA: DUF6114 domain-containing protein [Bacillales bacterium]|nr:DUF6114 domain-containing protein [Bacillales bacterium]